MLSACLVCSASSPFATCTSSTAPASLARCSTSALSRCQRSSFSVSMEKPMRTGPERGAWAVVAVSWGAFTQESRTADSRQQTAILRMAGFVAQTLLSARRRQEDAIVKPGHRQECLCYMSPSVVAAGHARLAVGGEDADLAERGTGGHAVAHGERELVESRESGVRRVPHLRRRQIVRNGGDRIAELVLQRAVRRQHRDLVDQRRDDARRGQREHRHVVAADVSARRGAHFESAGRSGETLIDVAL